MTAISVTAQLSVFDLIKSVLKKSDTLNQRFTDSRYYRYEPDLKSIKVKSFPYIVINIPATETDLLVMDNDTNMKTFTVLITLAVDKRILTSGISSDSDDKFLSYSNAIIQTIENNTSDFVDQGYKIANIDLTDVTIDVIDQTQAIVGLFELTFMGPTTRT